MARPSDNRSTPPPKPTRTLESSALGPPIDLQPIVNSPGNALVPGGAVTQAAQAFSLLLEEPFAAPKLALSLDLKRTNISVQLLNIPPENRDAFVHTMTMQLSPEALMAFNKTVALNARHRKIDQKNTPQVATAATNAAVLAAPSPQAGATGQIIGNALQAYMPPPAGTTAAATQQPRTAAPLQPVVGSAPDTRTGSSFSRPPGGPPPLKPATRGPLAAPSLSLASKEKTSSPAHTLQQSPKPGVAAGGIVHETARTGDGGVYTSTSVVDPQTKEKIVIQAAKESAPLMPHHGLSNGRQVPTLRPRQGVLGSRPIAATLKGAPTLLPAAKGGATPTATAAATPAAAQQPSVTGTPSARSAVGHVTILKNSKTASLPSPIPNSPGMG